ncbi:hypothetical protein JCM19231_5296 [Vibrio ishigakensis]|uniref:Uncharacterized protein n=1 Tax=Vibrio ishigakensis TaxID=1481914 RepID=A0A0B8NT85_9VIBR|nr:hypothetical protein JCM19231_5296 [Vibrio ishigakensis]
MMVERDLHSLDLKTADLCLTIKNWAEGQKRQPRLPLDIRI